MNAGDFANSLYRNGGIGGGAGRSDPAFSKPPTAAQLQAKKASALAPYAPGPARTGRTSWGAQNYIQNFSKYTDGLGSQPRQQGIGTSRQHRGRRPKTRLVPDGTTANQLAQPKYQRREAAGNSPGFYNIQGGRVDPRYQHGMPQGTAARSPQSSRMGSSSRGSSAPNMSAFSAGQAQPRQQSFGTPYGQSSRSYANLPGQWTQRSPEAAEEKKTLMGLSGSMAMRAGNFQESARGKVQADPYINSLNNQLAAARRAADAAREAHRNYKHTPGDMNSAIGRMGLLEDADNKQRIFRELERKLSKEKMDAEARFVAEERLEYAGGLGYDTSDPGVRFAADRKPGQVDIDALRRSAEGSQYQYAPITMARREDGSSINLTSYPGGYLEQPAQSLGSSGSMSGHMGQAQPRQQSLGTPYGQQFNPQSLMLPGFGGGPQMRTVNFDGSVTRQPNFALRDAFAQNINSAMMPYYQNSGTYLGEGAPLPTWGQAPQFNFPQLYGQATNMVANGYQNPLAGLFG